MCTTNLPLYLNPEKKSDTQTTYTPATLKNAQSKYVERVFGTDGWHQHLKGIFLDNYAGTNVTSKTKINMEREVRNPKTFPHIEEADNMIEAFIWSLRLSKKGTSEKTRHEEWVEAFAASEKSKRKLWSTADRLQIFGQLHAKKATIKPNGINVSLRPAGATKGEHQTYELSQAQILENIEKKVQLYYDPNDLSQVLVTDGKEVRFVAQNYKTVPGAFADYEEGDAKRIKQLQEEKKTLIPFIRKITDAHDEILDRAGIDAESLLQANVLDKLVNHDAQRTLTGGKSLPLTPSRGGIKGGANGQKLTENEPELVGVEAENETVKSVKKALKPLKQSYYDDY